MPSVADNHVFSSAAVPHNDFCEKSIDGQQDIACTAKQAHTRS